MPCPGRRSYSRTRELFMKALGKNAETNAYSSREHRKFQCKIAFSLPIHRATKTNEILIPGTPLYENRDKVGKRTEQHTLAVELRISDVESWRTSERRGDSHHDAYKFRQLVYVMNRVFKNTFRFPAGGLSSTPKRSDGNLPLIRGPQFNALHQGTDQGRSRGGSPDKNRANVDFKFFKFLN